jgi:hypothetical protein
MAAFCVSCGAPLAEGARFCPKCGAAVPDQPATPSGGFQNVPASTPAPVAPAPGGGSNTALKVIFGILGVFVFVGLLALGSCFYIGYRVKQRASQFSHEMGGDTPRYTGKREPCAMLTTAEAARALAQPVTSVEQLGISTCEYHYGPGGEQRLPVQYTWEGGAITLKLAHAAMKQVSAGMDTYTELPGIGDEAYLEPMGSGLIMRKGDLMVHIDLRVSNVNPDAAKNMAAKIAGRL